MLTWAEGLAAGHKVQLPRHLQRPDRLRRYEGFVNPVADLADSELPQKIKMLRRKKDAAFDRAVDQIIQKRDKAARDLDLDPSLLIARSVAESIAAGELQATDCLLPWQIEQLQL